MAKAALLIVIEPMESRLAPLMIRLTHSMETMNALLRKRLRAPFSKAMIPSIPAIGQGYELAERMFRTRRKELVPLWIELTPLKTLCDYAVNTGGINIEQALGKHFGTLGGTSSNHPTFHSLVHLRRVSKPRLSHVSALVVFVSVRVCIFPLKLETCISLPPPPPIPPSS